MVITNINIYIYGINVRIGTYSVVICDIRIAEINNGRLITLIKMMNYMYFI